ncbi:uncharacterized protein LOC114304351 [Camellia sinensis]|uniref:uncharacterized protein LOC114304351 n=1 Tax=Camellia sinensis TaxID=4442 RepID=UPI0010364A01|nr:uncharacterized protein LOC114304351 [Camellia sinensis]XP_028105309.1 uncharacterized protein LOC114304351 [Camellia sinensis]
MIEVTEYNSIDNSESNSVVNWPWLVTEKYVFICKLKLNEVKHLHCMDIKTLSEEASLELARELLIAISLCVPEKVLNLVASENLNNGNGAVVTNSDEDEELRSKLISIAYAQPPDASA